MKHRRIIPGPCHARAVSGVCQYIRPAYPQLKMRRRTHYFPRPIP
nr:MAG TPA: hypothetical protein [Caudoviricetes sp.]